MRILMVGWNRFGDAVMSTALIRHLLDRHPEARITLVCGALAADVLAPMPNLERMVVIGKHRMKVPVLRMLREFAFTRWDLIVDLKDTMVSRVARAPVTLIHRRPPPGVTTRAALSALVGTDRLAAPGLWFDRDSLAAARALVPEGRPVLALGIGASNPNRYWPPERFAALVAQMRARYGSAVRPLVIALGSGEEADLAAGALAGLPEDQRLDLTGRVPTILGQCACLARAHLFVGNDSGFMHAAGALGLPTVGLFGVSDPDVFGDFYADWRPVVPPGPAVTMADLPVDRVWAAVEGALPDPGRFASAAGRPPRARAGGG